MCDTEVDKSHPPEFLTRPKPLAVPEGSTTATFSCRVQGHPLPFVSWERNGCLLSSNEHYKISKDGERHILEVIKPLSRDSGQYVCHVQNSAGTASHNCSLIVTESTSTAAGGSSAAGSSGTVDYRALLKPRQNGSQVRTQRSPDSDRSDKENRVHDFRHVLRNNRQHSLPVSTTATTSSTTAASRFTHRTVPNGTSTHNSSATSSLSSVSSTASGRSGGVKRNLDLFEKQASPSPDRSTFTSRRSASPEGRPSSDRLGLRSRFTETSETHLSPGRDTAKVSGVPDRRQPEPVQESAVTGSSLHPSHATPTLPRERSKERTSRATSTQNTSRSLDRSHWRKSELSEPPKSDFRSVLSKPQGSSELGRPSAQPSTDSKPSWVRPDHSRDQKRNGHTKDIKQTASGKLDFRSVLKTRQTDNGRASSGTRDTKPKVQSTQSDSNFRSVLARLKQGEEETKKPAQQKTAPPKGTQEKPPVIKSVSSKDLNSLRARFESPGKDINTVQSKPPILSTISTTTTTTTTSITSSGRLGANTSDSTTPHWRERTRERTAPKVVENTKDITAEDKTLDVLSSIEDTSRFSDDLKCSDSSQLSDSAISSAFSKLSEFSDLSDSSSAVSEVEVQETRSRRRLERLKERLGGAGSGGEGEGAEETLEAPRIEQRLEDRSVTYGGQVVLQCKVSGLPAPDINWSINRKTIKPTRFFQLSYLENVAQLRVAEAFSEDEGEYTCTATNSVGTDSCSCYLTVEGSSSRSCRSGSQLFEGAVSMPPHVETLTPDTLTVRRGQSASFQVTFIGEPSPVVLWYRGKTPLHTDERVTIVKEGRVSTLTIPCAGANDCGRYMVTLTNDLGTDQHSATLSVEDVPECPMDTPHIYDISRKSVSLSWCGPAYDGGSVVTHYVIEVKDADSKKWSTLVDDCKSTSYHALSLKTDTSYQFRVRACNRLGLSAPSLPTPSVVMTDPLQTSEDYESDDELPFEPREVTLTPGRKFEDHYEYLHEVGKGKFGSVYKCKDKQTKKIWAAKVLKVREKEKAGVRQEVEVMNRLAHPKLLMLWDAFEAPRTMVLVIEYVGAGELFERVIRDDFVLTERDCVHFMRQICSGVGYMHTQSILHLDLKPENILCVAENSNQIKIIDFGLARFYKPGDSLQVLFGTPEFIAPEVVNYDAINFATDMWSIGVICYILLSGLSPFQGDNEAETLANVTSGEYDFDDESFDDISDKAKDFIGCLLVKRKEKRLTIAGCEKHSWLSEEEDQPLRCKRLNTDRLRNFMARRKWQKTGNAIRALGRMASMQKLLAGSSGSRGSTDSSISSTSDTTSAAPSISGVTTPVFSPPVHHPTSTDPLSTAAVKEVEEKRETTSAAATTTTTTTTTPASTNRWGAERVKGDGGKPTTEINGDLVKTTTTATDSHPSPPSWRRGGGGRESGEVNISSSPVLGRTAQLTQQNALQESADVTDSSLKGHREEPLSQRAKPTTTNSNNGDENETDNFSPTSQAHTTVPGDSKPCAPHFVKEMVDCTAFKGDVVRFDVTVTGTPLPRLAWTLEEEEVEEDARHVVEVGEKGQCSLIVRHVTEDDEGEYVCRAVNSQGEASCAAELSVYSMGSI